VAARSRSSRLAAAVNFASSIVARRGTLRSLYYDALKHWDESEALARRLHVVYKGGKPIPGHASEAHLLEDAHTAASSAAQDAANSLAILVDASLRRLAGEGHIARLNRFGKRYGDATLSEAMSLLATHVRHVWDWRNNPGDSTGDETRKRIKEKLHVNPTEDRAVARYVMMLRDHLGVPSYDEFEYGLLSIARRVANREGYQLRILGARVQAEPLA